LALLVALGVGLVLAATTAGRRADSAFPRFVAAHGYDAIVYTSRPLPLATLPGVAQAVQITAPFKGPPSCSCGKTINDGDFAVREVPPAALSRVVKLVSGRMPDQSRPREVLASYSMQSDYGVGPGTMIRFQMTGADQFGAVMKAMTEGSAPPWQPDGPVMTLTVTGIAVAESEFPSGAGASYDLYPTRAFTEATQGTPRFPFYYVRLRHGPADLARFESVVAGKYGAGVEDLDRPAAAITAAIHPQAIAWWVLAALAAVAAVAVAGQALARQTAAESADHQALAALGLRSGQFIALSMLRTVAVATAGAAGGVALAYGLSPLAPAGEARLADPAPGLAFDWPVAVIGAAASLTLVAALGLVAALRVTGRGSAARGPGRPVLAGRPSRLTRALAATGLPLAAVLGIRQAVQPGKGPQATPVGTALAGAAAGGAGPGAAPRGNPALWAPEAHPPPVRGPHKGVLQRLGPGGAPRGQPDSGVAARPCDWTDHCDDLRSAHDQPGGRASGDRRASSRPGVAVVRRGAAARRRRRDSPWPVHHADSRRQPGRIGHGDRGRSGGQAPPRAVPGGRRASVSRRLRHRGPGYRRRADHRRLHSGPVPASGRPAARPGPAVQRGQ
jgi:hypothetical protein